MTSLSPEEMGEFNRILFRDGENFEEFLLADRLNRFTDHDMRIKIANAAGFRLVSLLGQRMAEEEWNRIVDPLAVQVDRLRTADDAKRRANHAPGAEPETGRTI